MKKGKKQRECYSRKRIKKCEKLLTKERLEKKKRGKRKSTLKGRGTENNSQGQFYRKRKYQFT